MPLSKFLTVDRIEFVVTYRCNSRCKHCQIESNQRSFHPKAIDKELAAQIVRDVAAAYSPRSIMTFGGEPLLFPDVVCAIHATAKAHGIDKRQVITNAGWPRSKEDFRAVAFKLAESGITEIDISVDYFHQEYIPLSTVEQNVRSLVEAGIGRLRWNPCWVVSKEHDNKWNRRTKSVLQALAHLPADESEGNIVQPVGNAITWLRDYLPPKTPLPEGSCGDMPYTGRLDQVSSISVGPDGSIAVCDEFFVGNAAQRSVIELLQRYDPYQILEMKALLDGGVARLADLAHDRGVDLDPNGYFSVCDMCRSIRRKWKRAERC